MGFRVLFAGDRRSGSKSSIDALQNSGAEVDSVASAADGFALLRRSRYDLVCVDAALSSGSWLDFARDLRAHEKSPPLIVTSDVDCHTLRADVDAFDDVLFLQTPCAPDAFSNFAWTTANKTIGAPAIGHGGGDSGMRVLAYSHDSIGLGHMRRNANIISRMLTRSPGASGLAVIGSPAGFVFDLPDGMDFVKLPSLSKHGRDDWRPSTLNVSEARLRAMREGLFRQAVETFEPDVVLVDHMPTGVWDELTDTLAWLRRAPFRPHVALGLRDILDTPERTRGAWRRSGAADAIRDLYDEVLIYGDPDLFDTAEAYGLEQLAPGRVSYCGYVVADPPIGESRSLRKKLGAEDRPLILFSGGGGRDAYPMMKSSLAALALLPAAARPAAFFVAGPLMPAEERADLKAEAQALGCGYADRLPNFPSYLAAADRLVGMGGYNSVTEALNLGVPTLIVPRLGPSAEQMTRARLLADQGFVETISPTDASPDALARIFAGTQMLSDRRAAPIATDGADVAAVRLLEAAARRPVDRNPLLARVAS